MLGLEFTGDNTRGGITPTLYVQDLRHASSVPMDVITHPQTDNSIEKIEYSQGGDGVELE